MWLCRGCGGQDSNLGTPAGRDPKSRAVSELGYRRAPRSPRNVEKDSRSTRRECHARAATVATRSLATGKYMARVAIIGPMPFERLPFDAETHLAGVRMFEQEAVAARY